MKNEKNKFIIISSVLILAVLLLVFLASPLEKQKIPASFEVGENPGFNLDPGQLNFGKITHKSSAQRNLTIQNTYSFPTITKIKSSGPIQDYIIVSENDFYLNPNQSKELTFQAFAPNNLELGTYQGEIIIITRKA